jgi:hypothetical protein
LAEYLTDGYWADNGMSRRSFDKTSSNVITVNISDRDSTERDLAAAAMEAWEIVANIDFQTTSSGNANVVGIAVGTVIENLNTGSGTSLRPLDALLLAAAEDG